MIEVIPYSDHYKTVDECLVGFLGGRPFRVFSDKVKSDIISIRDMRSRDRLKIYLTNLGGYVIVTKIVDDFD